MIISPLNYELLKDKILLVQATESGIFFKFKDKTSPMIVDKPVFFEYDGILYKGTYGYTYQDGEPLSFIKNINDYQELEQKIINIPGIELDLYDNFSSEFNKTVDNIFERYVLEGDDTENSIYNFVKTLDNELLLKSEDLLLNNEWKDVFRLNIDFSVLNPTVKYKVHLKDNYENVFSGVFNIVNEHDITLVVERYDFSGDRSLKFDFVYEIYDDEEYVVLKCKLPDFVGDLEMESYFSLESFDSLYYTLVKELNFSGPMTINKTADYQLTNPASGMKTFYTKSAVVTAQNAEDSNIFIDSVVLPASCTIVTKNGNLLFPTQYELNNPISGSIGNIELAENDTIQVIYSFVLKRQDFVVDNTMLTGVVLNGLVESILLISVNGKVLFPTQYTLNGNTIETELNENDTVIVLFQ